MACKTNSPIRAKHVVWRRKSRVTVVVLAPSSIQITATRFPSKYGIEKLILSLRVCGESKGGREESKTRHSVPGKRTEPLGGLRLSRDKLSPGADFTNFFPLCLGQAPSSSGAALERLEIDGFIVWRALRPKSCQRDSKR